MATEFGSIRRGRFARCSWAAFRAFRLQPPDGSRRRFHHALEIAAAAKELDTLRSNWLNPPEWVTSEVLEFPGSAEGPWWRLIDPATVDARGIGTVRYPRLVPADDDAAKLLKKRTLTKLYNEWAHLAHPRQCLSTKRRLDEAVAAAYGWPAELSNDDLLARLLELNLARAK